VPGAPPRRHYLDHASASTLRPEARAALGAWLDEGHAADPGRAFAEGHLVRDAIESARERVAVLLGARPSEVVFTSGGSEAVNWVNAALAGAAGGARSGVAGETAGRGGRLVVCAGVEHSAVRRSAALHGGVAPLRVDRLGRLDLDHLDDLLEGEPALVHCQWGNHEVGTLQPVEEVVRRCRSRGVPVHVDACAAAGKVPIDFATLGCDALSVSSHKLGGPAGCGALLVRRGRRLRPLLVGGDQERARRAGMENVLGILGFGAAAGALGEQGGVDAEAARMRMLSERLLAAALEVPGVVAYGDTVARLPHIVCLGVRDVESEAVVLALDRAGLAVHSGSACAAEGFEPSPVLQAMGVDAERSLRCSFGWDSDDDDVEAFVRAFPEAVGRLRELAGRR
jgi:cysteine desulfurase